MRYLWIAIVIGVLALAITSCPKDTPEATSPDQMKGVSLDGSTPPVDNSATDASANLTPETTPPENPGVEGGETTPPEGGEATPPEGGEGGEPAPAPGGEGGEPAPAPGGEGGDPAPAPGGE